MRVYLCVGLKSEWQRERERERERERDLGEKTEFDE